MVAAVRPGGAVVLVENGEGGEFEEIRGRAADPEKHTARYNAWLEAAGFRPAARMESWFAFDDAAQADQVFRAIWGDRLTRGVMSPVVRHRIVVFCRVCGSP